MSDANEMLGRMAATMVESTPGSLEGDWERTSHTFQQETQKLVQIALRELVEMHPGGPQGTVFIEKEFAIGEAVLDITELEL